MQFVNQLYTPKSDREQLKLPSVRARSNTFQEHHSKSNIKKQALQTYEQQSIQTSSKINNIMMLEQMTHQIQQLKAALINTTREKKQYYLISSKKQQRHTNITKQDSLQDHSKLTKQYEIDISQELKQINDSRQKFMRCVMDTRQRNRSLQIYGDNLSPVIDKEKQIYKKQKDEKGQILLDSIRKQYTQRSPMGNAYCGIKALNKKSQDKVLRRLM